MNERPVHEHFMKGSNTKEKLESAFKEGFTHVIKFSAHSNSMYFARSLAGAIACKGTLLGMTGVKNVVIVPLTEED